LHADTHAEHGHADLEHEAFQCRSHVRFIEPLDRVIERADAGQYDL
jgi:hypothetical protein